MKERQVFDGMARELGMPMPVDAVNPDAANQLPAKMTGVIGIQGKFSTAFR